MPCLVASWSSDCRLDRIRPDRDRSTEKNNRKGLSVAQVNVHPNIKDKTVNNPCTVTHTHEGTQKTAHALATQKKYPTWTPTKTGLSVKGRKDAKISPASSSCSATSTVAMSAAMLNAERARRGWLGPSDHNAREGVAKGHRRKTFVRVSARTCDTPT